MVLFCGATKRDSVSFFGNVQVFLGAILLVCHFTDCSNVVVAVTGCCNKSFLGLFDVFLDSNTTTTNNNNRIRAKKG